MTTIIRYILIYFIFFFLFKIVTCLKLPLLEYDNSMRISVLSSHSSCLLNSPVVVVCKSLSHVQLLANPWSTACQASLSFTISLRFLKLMCLESVMPYNHLILSPHLPLPSIFPNISVSSELALCICWPKDWSFSFSISPSSEYLGLISFRIDLFDLLTVQGTLKSPLQHHSLKASFFLAVSLLYGPTLTLHTWLLEKPQLWLDGQTFVSKVMSLHFNILSRFVITFISRRKHILILWL